MQINMDEEVCFIDGEGNKIFCENISSHIGLAMAILEQDKRLGEEFKKSGMQDSADFLVNTKGWVKATRQGYYRKCVYSSSRLTEKQRKRLLYYKYTEGYEMDDLDIISLQQKNRNAGRWNTER